MISCVINCNKRLHLVAAVFILGFIPTFLGVCENNNPSGEWRIEFSGFGGVYSGKTDRDGDFYFTGSIEYGWPIFSRAVLGLRAYPLFLYREHDDGFGNAHWIYGAGVGVAARIYAKREEYAGWYIEFGVTPIWHTDYFEGNGSRVNFLNEIGLGYDFEKDWHLAIKWEHISNARLSGENAGVNAVGVAVGYRFQTY